MTDDLWFGFWNLFVILDFVFWLLFVICDLFFGFYLSLSFETQHHINCIEHDEKIQSQ